MHRFQHSTILIATMSFCLSVSLAACTDHKQAKKPTTPVNLCEALTPEEIAELEIECDEKPPVDLCALLTPEEIAELEIECDEKPPVDLCELLTPKEIYDLELDCETDNKCEPGKKKCDQNHIMECRFEDGPADWVQIDTCTDECFEGACIQAKCNVGTQQCFGNELRECIKDNGTSQWTVLETCPRSCKNNQCSDECPTTCTNEAYSCSGKTLKQCKLGDNGCYAWTTLKSCERYCYANTGKCAEDLPSCELTNNSQASIIQWIDGDTVWVRPNSNGACNEYYWDSSSSNWVRVRFKIRIHGIDAPECTKSYDGRYEYCTQDTTYTNKNERYGYESWQTAVQLLPANSSVILSCDEPERDGTCPEDSTGKRDLAYVGYTKNNASYDFSTELTRLGMAFANTSFESSKLKQICAAQEEAQNSHVGIWSTGGLSQMGSSKRHDLEDMDEICQWTLQSDY